MKRTLANIRCWWTCSNAVTSHESDVAKTMRIMKKSWYDRWKSCSAQTPPIHSENIIWKPPCVATAGRPNLRKTKWLPKINSALSAWLIKWHYEWGWVVIYPRGSSVKTNGNGLLMASASCGQLLHRRNAKSSEDQKHGRRCWIHG